MRSTLLRFYGSVATAILALAFLSASSSAQTYTPLFRFNSSSVGLYPNGGLIFDGSGNLYGTAQSGGPSCIYSSSGCGLVFELSPSGGHWTETVLYAFSGPDGSLPSSGLAFDSEGNLYGTTYQGGAYNSGTVFELTPTATGWQEQVLYSFSGGTDGGILPYGVVLDGAGNVYGTTFLGGTNNQGVLFQLTGSGSSWTENVLVDFNAQEGTGPSPLAFDANGNLYGEAESGAHDGNHSRGTIFELSPIGGSWTRSIFYTFTGVNVSGINPAYGVVFDSAGNLYGTVGGGPGLKGSGRGGSSLFELSYPSKTETFLLQVQYINPGGIKERFSGPLTVDGLGNVYAAVSNQFIVSSFQAPDGFVYRLGPSGAASYTFPALEPANRFYPLGGLAVDAQGNVYGATSPEGENAVGTVFELTF